MNQEIYRDSLEAKEKSQSNLDQSLDNLSDFRSRILGVTSYEELVAETQRFLSYTELPTEVYSTISAMISNPSYQDDYRLLANDIDSYLNEVIDAKNRENKTKENDLDESRQLVAEGIVSSLEAAGVGVKGGVEAVKDQLASGAITPEDVEKITDKVEETKEVLGEQAVTTEPKVEVSSEEVVDTREGKDIVDGENVEPVSDTPSTVTINDDGSISMVGANDDVSMNFTAMMMALLITSSYTNGVSLGLNFDAKILKDINNKNQFTATFGDFRNGTNKLNADIINMFNEQVKNFNPGVNYVEMLNKVDASLGATLGVLSHALGSEGEFRIAIKNNGDNNEIALSMDENYQDIADAFGTNGAEMSNDSRERTVIRISNDSAFLLNNTLETLNANAKEKGTLSNGLAYVYKMNNNSNDSGNVNTVLLTIIAAVEVVVVGFLISLIR